MNSQSLMANLGLDRIRRTSTDPDRSLVLKMGPSFERLA